MMLMRIQVIFLTTTMLLAQTAPGEFSPADWTSKKNVMVYIDGRHRIHDPLIVNTFFDRVIPIAIHLNDKTGPKIYENVVTAVLISENLMLTSFNAFRKVSQEDDSFHGLYVRLFKGRYMEQFGVLDSYIVDTTYKVVCAREVIPNVFNITVPSHMLHGIHSPTHDLMVFRLDHAVKFITPKPVARFDLNYTITEDLWEKKFKAYGVHVGPILTKLAKNYDAFESTFQFASIGHIDDDHIEQSRYLESESYTMYDKVITDCDEWLPREWGRFICILNTRNFQGIAAGAVLFSGEKLFGIGCFALWKGEAGILAFTDVRPYNELIMNTCTEEDQLCDLSN